MEHLSELVSWKLFNDAIFRIISSQVSLSFLILLFQKSFCIFSICSLGSSVISFFDG